MSNETIVTVKGNLVEDPELRFTPSGAACVNFRIASTPRKFDRNTNEWVDQETLFLSATAWRRLAENVAQSARRGTAVIVTGELRARSFETREGEKRTVMEITAESVSIDLDFQTAEVTRNRAGGQAGAAPAQNTQPQSAPAPAPAPAGAPAPAPYQQAPAQAPAGGAPAYEGPNPF